MADKPAWWPWEPYPEDIFPMTIEEYIKAIPDPNLRGAITGCIARFGWRVASDAIFDALKKEEIL